MNNIIKKCFKPSDEKYQFIIFVLLFMLVIMIYVGYILYYYEKKYRQIPLKTKKHIVKY